MFKKGLVFSCLGLFVLLLSSCATIVGGGPTQIIDVSSSPEGAQIWTAKIVKKKGGGTEVVEMMDTGMVTPAKVTIARKNAVIILKKEGYQDTNVVMVKKMNGWFWGNILIGGLIGSSIDLSTGASMKFDPNNFFVEMQPIAGGAASAE